MSDCISNENIIYYIIIRQLCTRGYVNICLSQSLISRSNAFLQT